MQERREGKKKAQQLKAATINEKGAETIAKLTTDRSLTTWSKLLKSDIESALMFKAIDFPKTAKKPELLQLLMKNICSFDNVVSVATEKSPTVPETEEPAASDVESDSSCDSERIVTTASLERIFTASCHSFCMFNCASVFSYTYR